MTRPIEHPYLMRLHCFVRTVFEGDWIFLLKHDTNLVISMFYRCLVDSNEMYIYRLKINVKLKVFARLCLALFWVLRLIQSSSPNVRGTIQSSNRDVCGSVCVCLSVCPIVFNHWLRPKTVRVSIFWKSRIWETTNL